MRPTLTRSLQLWVRPGWNIVSAANSYFYLVGRASAMVLDVSGAPVHTGIDMSAVRIFSSNHLFCASLRPPCAGTTITWG
jgi:hypothetical protein